jgi:hypothetical protein
MLAVLQDSVPAWIRPWPGPTGELRLGDDPACSCPWSWMRGLTHSPPLPARCLDQLMAERLDPAARFKTLVSI